MSERLVELQAILTDVRRRWTLRAVLRAWAVGATAAALTVAAGLGVTLLVARDGLPLVFTTTVIGLFVAAILVATLWPFRHSPKDFQIARLIEERADVDDVVATAVAYASRSDAAPRILDALASDAARVLKALDLDRIVSRQSIREQAVRAAAATAALMIGLAFFAPAASRATNVAAAYLFPARLQVEVTPGTTKLRAGEPLTITARVEGLTGEVVPLLTIRIGTESREIRMPSAAAPGAFAVTLDEVTASFDYQVRAAAARSAAYSVTVVRPPRVERIDLHYEFPPGLGLPPRTDEDSGDVYGPAGTLVRINVTTDKPIAEGHLLLADGSSLELTGQPQLLDGRLTIEEDGSYRVALRDHDGLESPGDTEYFIRTLDDRPPDVRILRPASDKQVSALEEVAIEARADDDFGIVSFDLVFQTPSGKERTVALKGTKGGLTASGVHTLFLEDLGVQPGDFVTYYARARDVNRGRRSAEARSDIFFLEVKPFEEEFVAAMSQSMGQGGGGQSSGLQGLAEAQKQIIVATWKLDARARRARDAKSERDVKAVAKAQSELRDRAEKATGQDARLGGDPRRRRGTDRVPPGENPLGRAVEAMGRAVNELDKVDTARALPHEMEALNQLLRAEAENRRREVSRQQQAGGGGGMNRPEADLSNLFDQELRRRQETNYETPNSTETREDAQEEDPLERIRELARRQDALNRQQQDLMRNRERLEEEELKRQLERLTREQNELRQQAEQLAERLQQRGSASSQTTESNGQSGGQGGGQSQDSRRLREISEDMRNAATGLRRQDPTQASSSGSRASERLRDLERQMQGARPDDRRRALGDVQLETRQLADAQRRLANEAARTAKGSAGDDARRRLAGDQERLAERAERLEEHVRQLAKATQGESSERAATTEAARDLERQKVGERMRQSAEALRQTAPEQPGDQAPSDGPRQAARHGEDLARALDRIADRLGAATGEQNSDSRRLSEGLSRTQELREKIAELEGTIEQLQREAKQAQQGQSPATPGRDGRSESREQAAGRQGPQRAQGGQAPGGSNGQQSPQGQEGASGQSGASTGGSGGRVQQLQREANERSQEVERLTGELRRENPGLQGPNQEEAWWRSVSAPGTEAFKQDFSRWESLKKNLLVSLEDVESKLSGELRARENKQRFNAGGHETVSEAYRDLVEKYYRSLATPRKPR